MEEKLQLHTKSSYRYALALFKLVLQEKSEKNTLNDVDNLLSLYKEQKTSNHEKHLWLHKRKQENNCNV